MMGAIAIRKCDRTSLVIYQPFVMKPNQERIISDLYQAAEDVGLEIIDFIDFIQYHNLISGHTRELNPILPKI
ncbi:hypothetical protein [Tolypothrix sp. VBCCA 56010]|uniref:hypothetical protein n=1 Tax=Tolypothrix sp. VBCCA 56010 TaxID=3137731 RepID=UPI003D7E3C5C